MSSSLSAARNWAAADFLRPVDWDRENGYITLIYRYISIVKTAPRVCQYIAERRNGMSYEQ